MKRHSYRFIRQLYNKHKGKCHWCGCFTICTKKIKIKYRLQKHFGQNTLKFWYNNRPIELSICSADHLIEVRDGGTDHLNNVVLSCVYCNTWRDKWSHPDSKKFIERQKEAVAKEFDLELI